MASTSSGLNRTALVSLAAVVSVFSYSSVQAAVPVPTAPIIFHVTTGGTFSGDLWEITAPGQPAKQLTNWGYNFSEAVSPDGQFVAYLSVPGFRVRDAAQNGGDVLGQDSKVSDPPTNVWVLNIATGAAVKVADQPANANDQDPYYIVRWLPAWSPDSKQLAWLELYQSGSSPRLRLVTYDVASQKNTLTVDNVPGYQASDNDVDWELVPSVAWSAAGIAYTNIFLSNPAFYLYSAFGKQLIAQPLSIQYSCAMYGWALDANTEKLVPVYCENAPLSLAVFDLASKTRADAPGGFTLYSPTAVGGGLTLTFNSDSCWQLGDNIPLWEPVGISPDGQNVVALNRDPYRGDNLKYTVYSGSSHASTTYTTAVPGSIDWLAWGPTALKFTNAAAQKGTCPAIPG